MMLVANLAMGQLFTCPPACPCAQFLACLSLSTHPRSPPRTHPPSVPPILHPPTASLLAPPPTAYSSLCPPSHHPSVHWPPLAIMVCTSSDTYRCPDVAAAVPCTESSDASPARKATHIRPPAPDETKPKGHWERHLHWLQEKHEEGSFTFPTFSHTAVPSKPTPPPPPWAAPSCLPSSLTPLLTAFLLSIMSSLQSSEWAGRFR